MVVPIQTAIVVLTRSTTATLRNSSSLVPALVVGHRVAMEGGRDELLARSGSGSRSPAICSIVNRSKGMFALIDRMT